MTRLHRKLKRIKSQLERAGVALVGLPLGADYPSELVASGGRGRGFNVSIEDGYVHFYVWPTILRPAERYSSVTAGVRRIKELFGGGLPCVQ